MIKVRMMIKDDSKSNNESKNDSKSNNGKSNNE